MNKISKFLFALGSVFAIAIPGAVSFSQAEVNQPAPIKAAATEVAPKASEFKLTITPEDFPGAVNGQTQEITKKFDNSEHTVGIKLQKTNIVNNQFVFETYGQRLILGQVTQPEIYQTTLYVDHISAKGEGATDFATQIYDGIGGQYQTKYNLPGREIDIAFNLFPEMVTAATQLEFYHTPASAICESSVADSIVITYKLVAEVKHEIPAVVGAFTEVKAHATIFNIPDKTDPKFFKLSVMGLDGDGFPALDEVTESITNLPNDDPHTASVEITFTVYGFGKYGLEINVCHNQNNTFVGFSEFYFEAKDAKVLALTEWADTYLKINTYDPELHVGQEGEGKCATYYEPAKKALSDLSKKYAGIINTLRNEYAQQDIKDICARYEAWALAVGDTKPYEGEVIVGASNAAFVTDNSNLILIITMVAITSITMTAFIFLSQRKNIKKDS